MVKRPRSGQPRQTTAFLPWLLFGSVGLLFVAAGLYAFEYDYWLCLLCTGIGLCLFAWALWLQRWQPKKRGSIKLASGTWSWELCLGGLLVLCSELFFYFAIASALTMTVPDTPPPSGTLGLPVGVMPGHPIDAFALYVTTPVPTGTTLALSLLILWLFFGMEVAWAGWTYDDPYDPESMSYLMFKGEGRWMQVKSSLGEITWSYRGKKPPSWTPDLLLGTGWYVFTLLISLLAIYLGLVYGR